MNNLQSFKGHEEPIRDVSFAPNDARFVTGSDDKSIKLWSFQTMQEERTLNGTARLSMSAVDKRGTSRTGHLWDVKAVKWHQSKGLLASGGKDSLIKFWDPRTGKTLTTLCVQVTWLLYSIESERTGKSTTRMPSRRSSGTRMATPSPACPAIRSSRSLISAP
jgi:WD40 repeat protein